ncbi:hypothetical protein AB6D37_16555 [Pectobacterium brasiliense]|uniref:hypothetical protein n=1 Tax=Pectobacterium brasiliense TaxID=180957 RepID=UPI0039880244
MANLPESPNWTDGVYQIERNDPVGGGPDGAANKPLKDLTNRTRWLYQKFNTAFDDLGWIQLGLWEIGLEISLPTQIVNYQGSWYRYAGNLDAPHVISGASPDEDGNWINVGDGALRSEIGSNLTYPSDDISVDSVPSIFNYVLYKNKYHYKAVPAPSDVDGIKKIKSGDGRIWEMIGVSDVYASDFCTDTLSLQKAYEAAASINVKFIIDAIFDGLMAVTEDPLSPGDNAFKSVIRCVDNSVIEFTDSGALKLANQSRPQSHLIYIHNCQNVTILNPVLVGDRLTNETVGEHGWGLTILQCENVTVLGGSYSDMHGDGIYIGKKWGTTDGAVPKNILIERPVVRRCRRNGISFCAGENVTINQPQIYNIGDSDGVVGAFPKSGIDVEPERDESTQGTTIPRLVNCVITDPYINGAYTGIDLNIFPENLIVELDIRGTVTLDNVTNRGITATRLRGGGIGKITIDRVLFKTNPIDVIFLEMLGNDRIFVEIGELIDATTVAGGVRRIRLAPRPYVPGAMSNRLGNVRINKCTSAISKYTIIAGYDLSQYHINVQIGQLNDPIECLLEFDNGSNPASIRGFIGGSALLSNFHFTQSINSTIEINPATNDIDVFVNSVGDFRELTIKRALTTSSPSRAIGIGNILFAHGGIEVNQAASVTFGAWIKLRNREGLYTEIVDMYGDWVFSHNSPM